MQDEWHNLYHLQDCVHYLENRIDSLEEELVAERKRYDTLMKTYEKSLKKCDWEISRLRGALERMTTIANSLCQGCCEQVLPSKLTADEYAYESVKIAREALGR